MPDPYVIVTGFGPFMDNDKNPSWQAVKDLPQHLDIPRQRGLDRVRLEKQEFRVAYRVVDDYYRTIRQRALPLFILHVGLAADSKSVRLEQRAFNETMFADVDGYLPEDHRVISTDPLQTIKQTNIDLSWLSSELLLKIPTRYNFKPKISQSLDAGRYLCNYSFYHACAWADDSGMAVPSLFVHVPKENNPHTIQELTCILRVIVLLVTEKELRRRSSIFFRIKAFIQRLFRWIRSSM